MVRFSKIILSFDIFQSLYTCELEIFDGAIFVTSENIMTF